MSSCQNDGGREEVDDGVAVRGHRAVAELRPLDDRATAEVERLGAQRAGREEAVGQSGIDDGSDEVGVGREAIVEVRAGERGGGGAGVLACDVYDAVGAREEFGCLRCEEQRSEQVTHQLRASGMSARLEKENH